MPQPTIQVVAIERAPVLDLTPGLALELELQVVAIQVVAIERAVKREVVLRPVIQRYGFCVGWVEQFVR